MGHLLRTPDMIRMRASRPCRRRKRCWAVATTVPVRQLTWRARLDIAGQLVVEAGSKNLAGGVGGRATVRRSGRWGAPSVCGRRRSGGGRSSVAAGSYRRV